MRIIRGPDGRGLGNYFLERSYVVKTENATPTTPNKLIVTWTVDHYELDPARGDGGRKSVFHGYSKTILRGLVDVSNLGKLQSSFQQEKKPKGNNF